MVSLKDIAAELNLSISVVSRALNPAPDANAKVASKTKKLVLSIRREATPTEECPMS